MAKIIKVVGFDPALANMGYARMNLNLDDLSLTLDDVTLIQTTKQSNKVVRQNSDDLRRATEVFQGFQKASENCTVAFAEVPTGSQNARAQLSFGVTIGILASCPIPLIQVQPSETKLATVGTKTASKQEMIEWATEAYPDASWLTYVRKGQKCFGNDNEHMADACAVVHAGLRTDEFKRLLAMLKSFS